jgi:hypothetical protein
VTASEAEVIAQTGRERIWEIARQRQVDAVFLSVSGAGSRAECWIRRESLNRWIAARDAEIAPYMTRPEAKDALGLTNLTIVSAAAAGAIRHVKGPDHNLPAGSFFFLREDIRRLKEAFEKCAAPVTAYSKPGELIALRHAMKNYLGRGAGLASAIQAVVDGALVPVGRTRQFRGITGYLFQAEDLRRYRPVTGTAPAPPGGFLNYRETAAALGVRTPVIRGLVDRGFLHPSAGFRNGFARLIPLEEVRQFAERYVSTSALAKRLELNRRSVLRDLKDLASMPAGAKHLHTFPS